MERPTKSDYIPTREGTEGLRVVRTGDEISVEMIDINGVVLDLAPVRFRQTSECEAAA